MTRSEHGVKKKKKKRRNVGKSYTCTPIEMPGKTNKDVENNNARKTCPKLVNANDTP